MSKVSKTILFFISVTLLLSMIFVSMVLIRGTAKYPDTYECFPRSFTIKINDEILPSTNLNKLPNLSLSVHDRIELTRTLPKIKMKDAMLIINASYAALEVFLDDTKIYSYGYENHRMVREVGAGLHTVDLPVDYQGKEIKIILVNSGNYKLPYILKEISLSEVHNVTVPIVRKQLFSFSMSIFLVLFGIMLMTVFMILLFQKVETTGLIHLSLASFSIGLWNLCRLDFVRLFSDNLLINSYVSYFSFYFTSIPWVFMVADLKKNAGYNKIFRMIKLILFGFLFSVIILHVTGLVDYKYFSVFYSVLGIFVLAFGLFVMSYKFKYQKIHEKMLFIGNIISVLYVFVELLLYYAEKLLNISFVKLPNAFLLMISTFFLSYGYRFSNNIASKKEAKILKQLAYTDGLTNLENRQSGMLKLMELEEKQTDYFVILFDLNNLKETNDTYGHSRGDTLLKDFARCLVTSFPKEAVKTRIGGDEFLVIYPTEDKMAVEKSMLAFKDELDLVNRRTNDGAKLEMAYGIASTAELYSFNNELIIQTADERMYANKREMKSGQADSGD